jgi:hypothetical protein
MSSCKFSGGGIIKYRPLRATGVDNIECLSETSSCNIGVVSRYLVNNRPRVKGIELPNGVLKACVPYPLVAVFGGGIREGIRLLVKDR